MKPSWEKILKIYLGECILYVISVISLLKIFLINQLFALNLTGNLLRVILFLNIFSVKLKKKTFIVFLNDSLFVPSNMSKEDWEALRGLADERDTIIKQAVKGSCGLV